uniref:At1g61320/AtMIF1 LRR domain-containing protein n=1 Tax=Tanacetum cinerariifolium TaxID=118510 RepID=A0A699HSP8_TANCI|nr:hypothetical protein [Tanacetum cinerariifolium]
MKGVDRLNELKDEMLVANIISRLDCTTKEVIKTTTTISKRWKNLWTSLPHLIFSDVDDVTDLVGAEPNLHGYMSFIDDTLNQCPTNLTLKRFKLDINFSSRVNSDFKLRANSWIRYAISRKAEDVDLRLWDEGVGVEFSYDDEVFFDNLCFNRVKLTCGVLNPPNGAISWGRLDCLILSCVTLDEDMIEKILSRSPCLESLELNDCYGYRRIDITSKSVKELVFSGYNSHNEYYTDDVAYIDCVKINAPYISSLTIEGELVLRELVLLNVSSLVKADLDYWINWRESEIFNEEVFSGLLESLGHVEDIAYGFYLVASISFGSCCASEMSVTIYEGPRQETEVHFGDPKQYEDQVTLMRNTIRYVRCGHDYWTKFFGVREAAEGAARAMMSQLTAQGVKLVLSSLLKGLEDKAWRTMQSSFQLFMIYSVLCSTTTFSVSTQDCAKTDPRADGTTADNLYKFDDLPLSLLVPIFHRGSRESRAGTKKKPAQIAANMCSLVTDAKYMLPYIGLLLPEIKKVIYGISGSTELDYFLLEEASER